MLFNHGSGSSDAMHTGPFVLTETAERLGPIFVKHGYAFLGEHFADSGSHIVLTPGNFYDEGGFKHKGDHEKWYRGPIATDYVLNEGDLIVAMTDHRASKPGVPRQTQRA